MTETKIQKALFEYYKHHRYKFLNIYFFKNESDWLSFLQNGMCYEIEIKISRSDFKADKKKERFNKYLNNSNSELFTKQGREVITQHPSFDLTREYPELTIARIRNEFNRMTHEYQESFYLSFISSCEVSFEQKENQNIPNKFFYAVPENLISVDELPSNCGLLYIRDDFSVVKVKEPKFIHKNILSATRAFNKAYYSYESTILEKLKRVD